MHLTQLSERHLSWTTLATLLFSKIKWRVSVNICVGVCRPGLKRAEMQQGLQISHPLTQQRRQVPRRRVQVPLDYSWNTGCTRRSAKDGQKSSSAGVEETNHFFSIALIYW